MFMLPDDGHACCDCHSLFAATSLTDMATECLELTILRVNGSRQKESAATVAFAEMELAAALAMAEDAISLVPSIMAIIGPALHDATTPDEVYEAIYAADRYWRNHSYSVGTANRFSDAMTLAVSTGVLGAGDTASVDQYFRTRVISGMERAAKYYTNDFFNRQVMPALTASVENELYGVAGSGKAGFNAVRATLDARLKSVPYWRLVANAAASRSYHYGLLKGGASLGRGGYRYEAVIDERTSDVCRILNGREWRISDAIGLIERIAEAEDPDEVKSISPWLRKSDVEGLSNAELENLGVIIPPAHGNCRSTLVLLA